MGRCRSQGLAVAENGIAPVYGEVQLVAAVTEAFDDLLPRPGSDEIDVRDRVGVAHTNDADIALTDLARPSSLTPNSAAGT